MARFLRFFSLGLCLFGAGPLSAADVYPSVKEPELASALAKYAHFSRLESEFKQTTVLKDLKVEVKSEGKLDVTPPDRVVWEVTKPAYMKVEFVADTIKIQNGAGSQQTHQTFKQNQVAGQKESRSLQMLVSWMKLDSKKLAEDYHISKIDRQIYQFEPVKQGVFKSIRMTLSENGYVSHVNIDEISGDSMLIDFQKPKITSVATSQEK